MWLATTSDLIDRVDGLSACRGDAEGVTDRAMPCWLHREGGTSVPESGRGSRRLQLVTLPGHDAMRALMPTMPTLPLLAAGWSLVLIASALALDGPGDAAAGRRLAETWCAACHGIDRKGLETRPSRAAPSFAEIAGLPSTTALSLNVFLRTTHQAMPDYHISRSDADDVVAYILSLKGR